jgi:hypothetical protein
MLLSELCPLSQSSQLVTIPLILKSSTLMGSHTPCKTQGLKFCSMLQGSRMECLTLKSGRCSRRVGKLKYSLNTKKIPYSQRNASKLCWTKVESWGLEPSAQSLAATRLNGNDFQCAARHGQAWLGKARPGVARRGAAWHGKHTASLWGCSSLPGAARPGPARLGKARQGTARLGMANTRHLTGCRSLLKNY